MFHNKVSLKVTLRLVELADMSAAQGWIVTLLILVPFAVAVSAILTSEARQPVASRRRERCLLAMLLLVLGILCALSVLHATITPKAI